MLHHCSPFVSATVLSHSHDPHVATLLFSCTAQACLLLSESQQRFVCECLECHFMVLLFRTNSQQNELHAVLTHSHEYRCISSNTHLTKLPLSLFSVCNRNALTHTHRLCVCGLLHSICPFITKPLQETVFST